MSTPNPNPPTARQLAIHAFMVAHVAEYGMPPSLRRIADHFGLASLKGVHDHLLALARKGLAARVYADRPASPWRPL